MSDTLFTPEPGDVFIPKKASIFTLTVLSLIAVGSVAIPYAQSKLTDENTSTVSDHTTQTTRPVGDTVILQNAQRAVTTAEDLGIKSSLIAQIKMNLILAHGNNTDQEVIDRLEADTETLNGAIQQERATQAKATVDAEATKPVETPAQTAPVQESAPSQATPTTTTEFKVATECNGVKDIVECGKLLNNGGIVAVKYNIPNKPSLTMYAQSSTDAAPNLRSLAKGDTFTLDGTEYRVVTDWNTFANNQTPDSGIWIESATSDICPAAQIEKVK